MTAGEEKGGCVSKSTASIEPQNAILRLGDFWDHIPASFLLSLGFLPDPDLALTLGWDVARAYLPWVVGTIPRPFQPLFAKLCCTMM